MAFEIYQSNKLPRGQSDLAKITSNGQLYLSNSHPVIERFNLLWDAETKRIGIHPKKYGTRIFSVNKGARATSIKALLEEYKIPYPQICKTVWDGDIYTMIVQIDEQK